MASVVTSIVCRRGTVTLFSTARLSLAVFIFVTLYCTDEGPEVEALYNLPRGAQLGSLIFRPSLSPLVKLPQHPAG